jgi:hypothetical protein
MGGVHPIWGCVLPFLLTPECHPPVPPQPPQFWLDGVRGERRLTHPVRPEIAASGFLFATFYAYYFSLLRTSTESVLRALRDIT